MSTAIDLVGDGAAAHKRDTIAQRARLLEIKRGGGGVHRGVRRVEFVHGAINARRRDRCRKSDTVRARLR